MSKNFIHRSDDPKRIGDQHPDNWIEAYGDALYRFAKLRVGRREVAEDLVQEAFLGGLQSIESFDGRSSILTWLTSILRHKIADYLRHMQMNERLLNPDDIAGENSHYFFDWGVWRSWKEKWHLDPEDQLQTKGLVERLSQCITKLPHTLRIVFMMRVFDDVKTDELEDELNITRNNSWVVLYRARMRMRECIDKNWFKAK